MLKKGAPIIFILLIILFLTGVYLWRNQRPKSPTDGAQKVVAAYKKTNASRTGNQIMQLQLIERHDALPAVYTCDGENKNPALQIKNVPKEAKSLILFMNDPDVPGGKNFVHWVVYGIDPKTKEIASGSVPAGAVVGENSFGKKEYGGPCPPQGQKHRYFFTLYALTKPISFAKQLSKTELERAIADTEIQRAETMTWYGREQ